MNIFFQKNYEKLNENLNYSFFFLLSEYFFKLWKSLKGLYLIYSVQHCFCHLEEGYKAKN